MPLVKKKTKLYLIKLILYNNKDKHIKKDLKVIIVYRVHNLYIFVPFKYQKRTSI